MPIIHRAARSQYDMAAPRLRAGVQNRLESHHIDIGGVKRIALAGGDVVDRSQVNQTCRTMALHDGDHRLAISDICLITDQTIGLSRHRPPDRQIVNHHHRLVLTQQTDQHRADETSPGN